MHPLLTTLVWLGLLLTEGTAWQPREGAPDPPVESFYEQTGIPDYATRLTELVCEHQGFDRTLIALGFVAAPPNRWSTFQRDASRVAGMLELFAAESEALRRFAPDKSDDPWPAFDALLGKLDHPLAAELAADAQGFLRLLERTETLDRLDHLAGARFLIPPRSAEALMVGGGHWLGDSRRAGRLCAVRAEVSGRSQQWDEAARSVAHALALARGAEAYPMLISYLVASDIEIRALRAVIAAAHAAPPDANACERLLEVLAAHRPSSLALALEGERLMVLDGIDRVYTFSSPGDVFGDDEVPPASVNQLAAGAHAEREGANRFFDLAIASVGGDAEAAASLRELQEQMDRGRWQARYPVQAILLPAIGPTRAQERYSRTLRNGTRTMLALELHRHEHGRYPDDLAALVPVFLDELPRDPFSDGPLRYKRIDPAADELGRSYLLYSVGSDGVDHGGRRHPEVNQWTLGRRRTAEGFDYIINDPRE